MVDLRQNTYSQAESDTIDQGLREYMLKVYNYMTSGLAISGLVAWTASQSPALMNAIYGSALQWVVMLAPLGFIFFLGARMQKNVKFRSTNDLLGFCRCHGTFYVIHIYTLYWSKYYKSIFYYL